MSLHEENIRQLKIMCENFKYLRKQKNWSIEELSEISHIKPEILQSIENNEDFDAVYLLKLCRVYNIKCSDIFKPINKY